MATSLGSMMKTFKKLVIGWNIVESQKFAHLMTDSHIFHIGQFLVKLLMCMIVFV